MKGKLLGIPVVCLLLSVATLSSTATAKQSAEFGRMRDYPGGPMIGQGIVKVMPEDSLKGMLVISGYWGKTERWFYDAEAVLIVKTPVEGPFRGTYVGIARRSDGLEMEITIQADFKPIPDSMFLDGHDAFYDITYPEGMIGIPENIRYVYFDGRPFEVPFETVEQGQFSGYDSDADSEYFVIRDDKAWTTFWADHKSIMFPTPPKPDIDFGNEMIIVAFYGNYASSGAGVQIMSIDNKERFWKVNVMRYTGLGMLPVVTNPYHIVKTPYTDLPVIFDVENVCQVPFDTVDQGLLSGYDSDVDGEYFVIRDDKAWTTFWAEHKSIMFPTPPKPEIDFGNEMIIVAFHGVHPNNGAGVSIQAVHAYNDFWEVDVIRGTGDGMLPVVTNPYHIVKTSYSDLPVKFNVEEVEL